MAYTNNNGQSRVGVRIVPQVNASSLWNSIYSVYNADAVGSSSLKTSLFAAYNGESNTNDSVSTNHGTLVNGTTFTDGKIGKAFTFDGVNDYVSLPDNSLNLTGDFTISVWVYPTAGTPQSILSNIAYASGTVYKGWQLDINNVSGAWPYKVTFATGQGPANNAYTGWEYRTTSLTQNAWNHILIKRVGGVNTYCWVNNISQSYTLFGIGANITTNPTYHTTQYNTIGSSKQLSGAVSNYLANGSKVDGVTVWNKALTDDERTQLYNSGKGAQYITDNFYKPTTNDALNTYNGTAVGGLTYEVGKVGTAFKFNGTNAYVNMGDVMDLGLSSWSYGMWFKSAVTSSGTLFSKAIATGLAGRFAAYIDSNRINFIFDYNSPLNSPGNTVNIVTSNTIVANTWYHLVCVFDRTSNIRLYLNGVLQSVAISYGVNDLSQYGAANTNYNTSCPFRIGAYTAADNINAVSFFNGSIDTFNVWNRVLTASEITELYNLGNGKQYPN